MMNNDDNQLDRLLSEWVQESTVPRQLQELQDRIIDDALTDGQVVESAEGMSQTPASDSTRPAARSNRRAARLVVSAAACALMATLMNVATNSGRDDVVPQQARFSDQQLDEKSVLVAEVGALFGSDVAWLAETNQDMEFEIMDSGDDEAAATSRGALPLVIRVVVERRQHGSREWRHAWSTDVVARDQHVVSVSPHRGTKSQLRLWAYQLPDGLIAIDSEVPLGDGSEARSTDVYEVGLPQMIASRNAADAEYRVFQTVAVIDAEVG